MTALTQASLKTLLGELVQMPTLNTQPATTRAAIDWVKYQLQELPLHITDANPQGHATTVFSTRRTKQPKLMLHAHIDVIPASVEQFSLVERDGRYYGRGVFDMKFAIACYLQVLAELGERLPEYDLAMSLTSDEEGSGGMGGAKYLMATGWRPGVVLNPDSTGNDGRWSIQRAAKGALFYLVTAEGKAAHGSRTWLAPSANLRLIQFLSELSQHFPSEPCGDPEHAHATLNIGRFNGGSAVNQVAAGAQADLDIRIMPEQGTENVDVLMHATATRHEGITWERIASSEPVGIAPNEPHLVKLKQIMQRVTGTAPELILSHGASEACHFAAAGLPVLMFGPPAGGHHSDAEWINARGVTQSGQIIRQLVEEVSLISR